MVISFVEFPSLTFYKNCGFRSNISRYQFLLRLTEIKLGKTGNNKTRKTNKHGTKWVAS